MNIVLIVCVCLIFTSVSVAAPTSNDAQAKIVNYVYENDGQGNYEYSFETTNGILRRETGKLVNVGEPNEHIEVEGSYSYQDAEGNPVTVYYTADENGYHIQPPIMTIAAGLPSHAVATLLG